MTNDIINNLIENVEILQKIFQNQFVKSAWVKGSGPNISNCNLVSE